MTKRGHIRILLIATVVWAGFWVAGLPFYYQQYSDVLMVWFDSLLLIPLAAIVYLVLRRLRPERRFQVALWLAFYFTVPLARTFHESPAAIADMSVLPGVLGPHTLRRTVQVRLGSEILRLPGGTPICRISRRRFMKCPG